MVYALFGMPLFVIWASHVSTFMAETFKVVYANTFHCILWRGRQKITESLNKEPETKPPAPSTAECSVQSEEPKKQTLKLPRHVQMSRRDALTNSEYGEYLTPEGPSANGSPSLQRREMSVELEMTEVLATCAMYNLGEGIGDAVDENVMEEIRLAPNLDILNERSLSPISLPKLTPVTKAKNPHVVLERVNTPAKEQTVPQDGVLVLKNRSPLVQRRGSLLLPPPPRLVGSREGSPGRPRDASPASSTRTRDARVVAEEGPPTIDRVPPLPVLCLFLAYLTLGATIFWMWEEHWSFVEGLYFCFITLTTIGLGDYVPGDSIDLSGDSEDTHAGQYRLICSVLYLLFGICLEFMTFNLIQEEAMEWIIRKAKDCGIIDSDEDEGTL